jgi:hypothetical protein
MFPVRYELNSYIIFRRNSVFKGLNDFNFKFWTLLKLEKFFQLRDGCMYDMIVMGNTNMDPYWDSSLTRGVFDETA